MYEIRHSHRLSSVRKLILCFYTATTLVICWYCLLLVYLNGFNFRLRQSCSLPRHMQVRQVQKQVFVHNCINFVLWYVCNCIAKLFELFSKLKSLDLFSRILCVLHASLYLFKMSALLYMNMTCGQKIFDAGVLCMANIYVDHGGSKIFRT